MEDSPNTGIYSSLTPYIRLEPTNCPHSSQYWVSEHSGSGSFCGLCWLIDGFESEVPRKIHSYKQLAENGNPETSESFMAHAQVVMGLSFPKPGEDLKAFRRAREQYSRPLPGRYPVTSALWQMLGYQPPLAEPLTYKLYGWTDWDIAAKMGVSYYNIQIRLIKATRLALRYVRNDATIQSDHN